MKNKNKKTALYRMFDCDGQLLYVGISQNWFNRLNTHFSSKPWVDEITNITIAWYASTPAAALAERTAIRWENPVYNIQSAVKDTVERKHFESLFGPSQIQPDDFHKSLVKLSREMEELCNFECDNKYEWAVLNALWELSKSEEVLEIPCAECIALGNTWWLNEGHYIICDMKVGK